MAMDGHTGLRNKLSTKLSTVRGASFGKNAVA